MNLSLLLSLIHYALVSGLKNRKNIILILTPWGLLLASLWEALNRLRDSIAIEHKNRSFVAVLSLLFSMSSGFFGRKLGVNGSLYTYLFLIYLTMILSILWDSLTVSMLIPVLIVSSLVFMYSIGYMKNALHNQIFFSFALIWFMLLFVSILFFF